MWACVDHIFCVVYLLLLHLGVFIWRTNIKVSVKRISWVTLCVWLFVTPSAAACLASLSIMNSQSLQAHGHRVSDAIQPSHPLSPSSPPARNLSQHQGLFQWVSSSHHVAKVLEFQLQHQYFQWIFRTDFLYGWLVWSSYVQGALKSLVQHHGSKASILQCSAFFLVHLSHPYMTTGKTIALTRWTFIDRVMSLLFNMLSRLVI